MKIKYILLYIFIICFSLKADQKDPFLNELFIKLHSKSNQYNYDVIISKIWDIWLKSDDVSIDRDFQIALSLMKKFQYKQSIIFFSRVIEKKPDFAEAWNKRATAYYLIGDYEKSISDINYTLILEPRHFGAMDGLALIFIKSKKYSQALEIYREILKILPYSRNIKSKIKILEEIISKNI